MSQEINVPPYHHTFATKLNRQQSAFYRRWRKAWERGEALSLDGQTDYIMRYVETLPLEPLETALNNLLRLRDFYGDVHYKRIADCYVLLEKYEEAIEILKAHIQVGSRQESFVSKILSYKLLTGERIDGQEILALYGPQLTTFGKNNIDKISRCIDILLNIYEIEYSINLIEEWARNAHQYSQNIQYLVPLNSKDFTIESIETGLTLYSFRDSSAQIFVKEITRLAENIIREEAQMPHVGQGWISESELYDHIKKALPDYGVTQHYSPPWLGRQHLDIFIPKLEIGLEYQGRQHNEPIEYFGGEEAFEKTQERDARKKRLCDKHGVHLIYVFPNYNLINVLDEIKKHAAIEVTFENSVTKSPDLTSHYAINTTFHNQLLKIALNPEPEPDNYELKPEFYVEPLQLESDYKVTQYKIRKHRMLDNQIAKLYRERDTNPDAIERVIELCKKQIDIAADIAHYYHQDNISRRDHCLRQAEQFSEHTEVREKYLKAAENNMQRRTIHFGYRRLVIILEKQQQFEDALKFAVKAKSEHWDQTGYWDKVIIRLLARLGK